MSDPIRYLDREDGHLGRALLRSADIDHPTPRSVNRALRAAAIAAAATTATGTGAAAGTLAATTTTLWLKWLGIGLVVGGISALGTSALMPSKGSEPLRAAAPGAPLAPATTITQEPAVAPPAAEPAPAAVDDTPERAKDSTHARAPAASGSSELRPDDSLARELERVDSARRQLAAGNANGAIAELDRYRKEFPRGRFAEESALIRAQALVSLGNCSGAIAIADSFGGGNGRSVLDRRWKTIRERCR